jgi:FlaA1/EpsC-like NDP-sugar epimerase
MLMITQSDYFKGKNVLVTGGAGSIGKEIVQSLLGTTARTIRVFDNNETGLHDLALEFGVNEVGDKRLRFQLGDVTNENRLVTAMENVHVVFHAAALKHVPLCEYNPFEATRVNILGTQNCIDAARRCNVDKMIFISTDKAVSPFSVMGATKLVAERLVLASNIFSQGTKFSCVRFGNVLNSRGSVIPIFKKQIFDGGPITITDPNMTRFFMTIPQAVELILTCAVQTKGDEIFVLKMSATNICDLADAMVEYYHETAHTEKNIERKIIGIRPGEKMYEELISSDELGKLADNGSFFVISRNPIHREDKLGFSYSSNEADRVTKSEIKKILAAYEM